VIHSTVQVELGNLQQLKAPAFFDESRAFDPTASSYREHGYNKMSENKWRLALDILQLGVGAMMIDPDIAMLRNPLPYLVSVRMLIKMDHNNLRIIKIVQETLPSCDFTTMMECVSNDPSISGRHVSLT
jgi:hypothetical protein